jgi:hypothetical protein
MVISKYYYINNVPVQIRFLPSGDIAIWHPCNKEIAYIIDGVCRNRGRWNSHYNNWIVFSQFKHKVISDIKSRGSKNG